MKKLGWIFGIVVFLGLGGAFAWRPLQTAWFDETRIIEIAVVGPLSGPGRANGEAMLQGVRLYLQQNNYREAFSGRTIQLQVVNDQDNAQVAAKRAAEITTENQALLVIGHSSSNTSLAASDIYQKAGIPAITASATDDAITRDSEWYFRTIPNNRFQGAFIAQYVKNILQQEATSIIADKDGFGSSLANSYEQTARDLGLRVNYRWEFDREQGDLEQRLKTIIIELRALKEPGVIFFATHESEAVKIITSVKFPGTSYLMIGPDTFATAGFRQEFEQYPQEQAQPGYYSDGVYAISPFIPNLAGGEARQFLQDFKAAYGQEPMWDAACYYDVMAVVVGAIQRAELDGQDLRSDRKKVQEVLAGLINEEVGIPGVMGPIYFDQERNVQRPLAVGIYTNQILVPAPVQYHLLPPAAEPAESSPSPETAPAAPDAIRIQNLKMTTTQIVSTGIDVNEISRFDLRKATFTADFYLWFRFRGELADAAVTFLNAVTPITLETPVFEKHTADHLTVRAYHVKADFKATLEFALYPFEQPVLPITFRHVNRQIASLRYVPDVVGLSRRAGSVADGKTTTTRALDWIVTKASNSEKTAALVENPADAKRKQPPRYSQFTAANQMARQDLSFVAKNFLPILLLTVMLYLVYYLPVERLGVRSLIFTTILGLTLFYQLMLHLQFPGSGLMLIDVGFGVGHLLVVLAAGFSIAGHAFAKRQARRAVFLVNLAGRSLHPLIVALACGGLILAYAVVSQQRLIP